MTDKITDIRRCYGMEKKIEKNKSNENFNKNIISKNCDRQLENVEFLNIE
jgi:hypothetical protein